MIPQPPADSCFELDRDGEGRTRLTWRPPYSARERLATFPAEQLQPLVFYFLFASFFSVLVWSKFLDSRYTWGDWLHLGVVAIGYVALPTLFALGTGFMLVMFLAVLLGRLCPRPWPERITFTSDALLYEPSCFFRWARRREVPRGEIWAVRSRRIAGLDLLLLDHGVRRLRLGAHLSREEVSWLVQALRAWIASGAQPACAANFPPLPKDSWIRVERGAAGERRLSWLPRPSRGVLGFVASASLWFAVGLLVLGIVEVGPQMIAMAGGLLEVFRMGIAGALFAIVFGALSIGVAVFGHYCMEGTLRGLWKAFRRPRRPESLTLTASGLVYDPGRYLFRVEGRCAAGADQPAAVEEITRWAIQDIYLEDNQAGRHKLFISRRGRPLEIGRHLREPEREWLAEVLGRWARPPASTP